MPKGHQTVLKIIKKSWTAGIKDNTKATYHVGQNGLHLQISHQPGRSIKIVPVKGLTGFDTYDILVE